MRWPRDEWIDDVIASELPPLARLVAVVYGRRAGSRDIVWVSTADLMQDSGLSRNASRRALRALVESGWLELVEAQRQQFAARYRMVRPVPQGVTSGPAQGVLSEPSEEAGGSLVTPSGGSERTPGGSERTPGGHLRTPKYQELQEPPPTTAAALWLVLVDNLPQSLADTLTRSQRLDDALRRHADEGWTANIFATAVRERSWRGAQGGAVVHWLSNLQAPSASRRRPSAWPDWCGDPTCHQDTRMRENEDGDPYRCPACGPTATRRAS